MVMIEGTLISFFSTQMYDACMCCSKLDLLGPSSINSTFMFHDLLFSHKWKLSKVKCYKVAIV